MIVAEMLELDEAIEQRIRHNDVSEAKGREQNFAECAGVNEAIASVETLQTRKWGSAVSQLRVVVVFDDPRSVARGEVEQREPARERERHASWKLTRRRGVDERDPAAAGFREAQPLLVDATGNDARARVRPREARLDVAGIFDINLIARLQ